MTGLMILLAVIVGVFALVKFIQSSKEEPRKYQYKKKEFFMSRAEHQCYDALVLTAGDRYYIFPQVHLPSIVDNKVVGQSWKGAFWHISQKSVDFVLCDKSYICPKLAIELDDRTHERQDRVERDEEVERVLKDAKLPLLRLSNQGSFNPKGLAELIDIALVKGAYYS